MESGGKIWTCLLKLHSTCPKEHFEKEQLLKVLIFFKLFRFLNEDSPSLAKKLFGRDIKIENCSLRLKRSIKKSNFWKFSFFSNSSEVWMNIYCAWRETFRQGYQNWKMQFSSHKINQKIKLLKVLFIYQTFQNFERTFTVLGKEVFGRDIKIENCSLCLKRSIKKSNFWKFSFFSNSSEVWMNIYRAWRKSLGQGYQNWKLQSSSQKINQKTKLLKVLFFSNSSELWTNNYRAWRKSFGQGYQNWKLYFLSSEYHVGDKNIFRKFCNVSFYSDLEYISFGFEATEFSPSLSKIQSTCLYEFSLRSWY